MYRKGFEPPTHGLEGRCSIQLSYRYKPILAIAKMKAGDGNRTHVSSLEGWCSTIEPHPQEKIFIYAYLQNLETSRGDRIRTCDPLIPNQVL